MSVAAGPTRATKAPDPVQLLSSAITHLPTDTGLDPPGRVDDVRVHRDDGGWVVFAGAGADDRVDGAPACFTVPLVRSVRHRAGEVSTASLATMLGDGTAVDGAALAALLPPFAVAHRAGPDRPIVVAADWLGFRHLYWWQGDGVAAVSTSALALAALSGARLDTAALGVQSLLGWQIGQATLFEGVHKLAPGCLARLHRGQVRVDGYVDEPAAPRAPLDAVTDGMARLLRELLTGYLADHPDTVLQLSGGLDSRLLLCAVPPVYRVGLPALTIDVHGGAESTVAGRLSAACALDHRLYWLDEQRPVEPSTAHRLALQSAAALDCMASPMALAPLAVIESTLDQAGRLSGVGGEIARGFYYPGQPRRATTSPRLVNRLAEWRLFANEAVRAEAVEPEFAAAARVSALDAINACFADHSVDWLSATDTFYLFHRTQRWAGAHGTPAGVQRLSVNPLLDRGFTQLALAASPADRRNSRLVSELVHRLDPALAAIPLDSGLVPARLRRRGPATAATMAAVTVRKAARKAGQRFGRVRRAQLGAAEMAGLVVAHWRAVPESLAPLYGSGVLRDAWLDDLLDGRRSADAATVAFVVNLLVAGRAAAPTRPPSASAAASTPEPGRAPDGGLGAGVPSELPLG